MRSPTLAMAALALCAPGIAAAEEQHPKSWPVQAGENAEAKIAAIQAHVDAYRSGDLDRFVSTFTHDAIVRADGFVAIGRDQIRALYELNFVPGAPSIKVHDSGLSGENVYLTIGYVFEGGQEMCCSYSEYEVRDGKVSFLETGAG